tara:strand:+ start:486 stop:1088 length:603 start_codon:yes stop_codon:yes gene_type:complete
MKELKEMLQALIPCISGRWFISDGALLGIVREGDLIEYDDDIDIFIFPDTIINWEKLNSKYSFYKDYMCYKVYNGNNEKPKCRNDWNRFTQYSGSLPECYGFNRGELYKFSSKIYREERIELKYTKPWLDIFTLEHDEENERYVVPYYFNKKLFYYNYEELELKINYDLGFKIFVPNKAEDILCRQYGEDYMTPNPDFKW